MCVFWEKYVSQLKICIDCGTKEDEEEGITMKSCAACGRKLYCSKECQKVHWKKHKKLCKEENFTVADVELTMPPRGIMRFAHVSDGQD